MLPGHRPGSRIVYVQLACAEFLRLVPAGRNGSRGAGGRPVKWPGSRSFRCGNPRGYGQCICARRQRAGADGQDQRSWAVCLVSVEPVAYDVAIEAQGFAREMLRDVKVDTLQETGLGSIKMQLKSAAQTVEVTSEVQSVQLSNVEVSSTVATSQVENLPMLERQVVNLFPTQAGVNAGNAGTTINGQHASATNIMLDGINVQDNYVRTNDVSFIPIRTTIDQIAEFTVITSNANASLGGGASQVVLSTKSGSNTYHGSLYWYNRNAALTRVRPFRSRTMKSGR